MGEKKKQEIGAITWMDLTVENAEEVQNFYREVAGWTSAPVSMGDYSDFSMNTPESDRTVAGICHARGGNADLPPQWLIYITVADVDQSAARCAKMGGNVITGPKDMGGHGRYCVVEDPAGAVAAPFEPAQ